MLAVLEPIARDGGGDADVIVIAGKLGIEQAAPAAGFNVEVPFMAGRRDASQEMTDSCWQRKASPAAMKLFVYGL
ncbi:MAG: catalase-peroxidase [Pseudoalteromonas tetraodonis]